jgi:hypothetical protein
MRQAELVVRKPVADVDDSFALAEPPAHDDWVPQAVQDKRRRREVQVALTRIRDASDQYLSPRKSSAASSEAPPSAAHVGDMLADLLGALEGPAPSTRVTPSNPVVTSSGASAGSGASGTTTTGTIPAGPAAGRRAGRPRVNVVAESHTPAQSPGWTRTTMDIQLANGSPVAPTVDVSVRVGYNGGSVNDTEVIRIIGWPHGSGDKFVSGPIELPPDVVRQFVFEAQSDLAIYVETKLAKRSC